MHRRAVLGTLAAGCGTLLAGCSGSRVEGEVASNETPLALSHEYSIQATPSGTRIVVDVTAENEGSERVTPEAPVPRVVCTFFDDAGETLYRSGLELTSAVDVGGTIDLEFTLGVDVDDVARYTLRGEWVEE
jgi:hypothetical protein